MRAEEYMNKLEAHTEEGKHMTDTSLPFAEKKFTEAKGFAARRNGKIVTQTFAGKISPKQ